MRETNLYARPTRTLHNWSAIKSDSGTVTLHGFGRHGEILQPVLVLFLDAEKQLGIDDAGVIWHIPAEYAKHDPLTQEFRALLCTPRYLRPSDFIFADDCPELRRLLSKDKRK
jgi:hypothetical protein